MPADGNPSAPKRAALPILRHRRDFLAAAKAGAASTPGLRLQGRDRDDGDPTTRVGFTCSKKVGNAVARNRAKRRLREAARLGLPDLARPGWDYVLIGLSERTAGRRFEDLLGDLANAVQRVHNGRSR